MDVLAGNGIGVAEGLAFFCGDFAVEEFLRVVIFDRHDVNNFVTSSGARIFFFNVGKDISGEKRRAAGISWEHLIFWALFQFLSFL